MAAKIKTARREAIGASAPARKGEARRSEECSRSTSAELSKQQVHASRSQQNVNDDVQLKTEDEIGKQDGQLQRIEQLVGRIGRQRRPCL